MKYLIVFLKSICDQENYKDDLVVNNTCSCRGCRFNSQHLYLYDSSQPSLTPGPGNLIPSSKLGGQ